MEKIWVCFVLILSAFCKNSSGLSPIILVPGDGGSQLEAKLNKPSVVHYICDKQTTDYFSLWLNLELLVPVIIDCWVDNIKLVYDNVTRKTTNQPGVDIRIPGFGDPFPVEWLDPTKASAGSYFNELGDALVAIGYERNVSLRGAPYDFRKGPSESLEYFDNLKQLVEDAYESSSQKKVIFIAHSMGGPMTKVFLQMQPQAWKDKYIQSMISLSGAFAGSVKTLKVFVTGDDLGVLVLPQSVLKQMQITSPSLTWLMPNENVWKDTVLISTDSKNYSLSNIKDFFEDIDYMVGWEMRQDQLPYVSLDPPGVEVHCLYGVGVQTISKLTYKPGKFPSSPSFEYGAGDGTVNLESLDYCSTWKSQQKQKIYVQPFHKIDHMKILNNIDVVNYVLSAVKKYEQSTMLSRT